MIRKPTPEEALIGWDRYETLRRLSPRAFGELWTAHLTADKPFDALVDDLKPFLRPTEIEPEIAPELLKSIWDLELTTRTCNCLKAENINTIYELTRHPEWNLKRVPNLGKRSIAEIKTALELRGLHLGMVQ